MFYKQTLVIRAQCKKVCLIACSAIIFIVLIINIPRWFFAPVPLSSSSSLSYASSGPYCHSLLNGIPLLHHILSCNPCPYNAKCSNGIAKCSSNHHLDKYGTICLSDIDYLADEASFIAHFV